MQSSALAAVAALFPHARPLSERRASSQRGVSRRPERFELSARVALNQLSEQFIHIELVAPSCDEADKDIRIRPARPHLARSYREHQEPSLGLIRVVGTAYVPLAPGVAISPQFRIRPLRIHCYEGAWWRRVSQTRDCDSRSRDGEDAATVLRPWEAALWPVPSVS